MSGKFCFLSRIFSQTFRALICGHKFSDPEFCKNKKVSPCPLALRSHAFTVFISYVGIGNKSWKLRNLLLQATWRGALSLPYTILHPISLDFPDLPLIINNNYEKVSVYTRKKGYHHKHSSFHSQWNWSYSWCSVVMLSSHLQGSI